MIPVQGTFSSINIIALNDVLNVKNVIENFMGKN